MNKIKLDLDLEQVNNLCKICDTCGFDVNVIAGQLCVDGCSVMGVMGMTGRTVEIVPVTSDIKALSEFIGRVKELGAYEE